MNRMKREEYLNISEKILDGVVRYNGEGNRVAPEETIQSLRSERDELKRRNAELARLLEQADRLIIWEHNGLPHGYQEAVERALTTNQEPQS